MIDYNMGECFRLYASCIPVKGITSSLIIDLERRSFYEIENDLFDLIINLDGAQINTFKESFDFEENAINHFVNQFIQEELGFITNESESFPKLELVWKSPYKLENAVIEFFKSSTYLLQDVINQLDILACQAYQLHFDSIDDIKKLNHYLSFFDGTKSKYIEIIVPFSEKLNLTEIEKIIISYPRLRYVKLYKSPYDKIHSSNNESIKHKILFFKKDIMSDPNEIISLERFIKNKDVFCEAQNYNIGLNRKVTITSSGEIKNFLGHETIFGNVSSELIQDVIEDKLFQKKWLISNDEIEKCKDCMYRYSCLSNSDLKYRDGIYHKVKTCNYNPNNNTWN